MEHMKEVQLLVDEIRENVGASLSCKYLVGLSKIFYITTINQEIGVDYSNDGCDDTVKDSLKKIISNKKFKVYPYKSGDELQGYVVGKEMLTVDSNSKNHSECFYESSFLEVSEKTILSFKFGKTLIEKKTQFPNSSFGILQVLENT